MPTPLDTHFLPAAQFNQQFQKDASSHPKHRHVLMDIRRPEGTGMRRSFYLFPDEPNYAEANLRYTERLLKSLLWIVGGNRIAIDGAPEIAQKLTAIYSPSGTRSFDAKIFAERICLEPISVIEQDLSNTPAPDAGSSAIGGHLDGCRIGFDLGGSDRKCAAMIDGKIVFSEEIPWNPYFESDPNYHVSGIRDSLLLAAKHLPRVDAIGGSCAGYYVNNEPRVASLFRNISDEDFSKTIRPVFKTLQKEWNDVPFDVANDGDVTALAGAMSLGVSGLLGLSMGTSQAGGYINRNGVITGWINELAFIPIDFGPTAAEDEWSKDVGCGVQYFSQQAVYRLIPLAGLDISPSIPAPEALKLVQEKMAQGDERAVRIYETIGLYLGHSIPLYAEYFDMEHILLLGRVLTGKGGDLIIETAQNLLKSDYPVLAEQIQLNTPDEAFKRHGQAIAAASLPLIPKK